MTDYLKKEDDELNKPTTDTNPDVKMPDVITPPREARLAAPIQGPGIDHLKRGLDVTAPGTKPATPTTTDGEGNDDDYTDYSNQMKKRGMYDFLKGFYDDEKTRLEREERRARRARSAALMGDLAKVAGQTFAASRGARQFQPITSGVPAADERIEKIRDAGRALDADYRNKSLTLQMQEEAKREAEEQRRKQREQDVKDDALKFEHQKELAQIAAGNKEEQAKLVQQYKLELEEERHKNRLSEIRLRGGVKKSDSGEYEAADENGQIHTFKKKDAAVWYAKQHGTWKEEGSTVTEERDSSTGKTTKKTTKPGGYPSTGGKKDDGTAQKPKSNHKDNPYDR
jgi:hypothetical protein